MKLATSTSWARLGERVRIDAQHQRLWRDGLEVRLRPKAWQALSYLLQRPGELVTGTAMLEALWPEQEVSAKTLANLLIELRAALGDDNDAPQHLLTVHRRGYRLVLQPPTFAQADQQPPSAGAEPASVGARQQPAQDAAAAVIRPAQPRPDAGLALAANMAPLASPATWVGREAELNTLNGWFHAAVHGQRGLGLVAGDPGVGKSALLDRFVARVGLTRAVTARGACTEQATAREPFAPVLALLSDLCSGPLAGQASSALRRCAPSWLLQLPWLVQPHEVAELRKSLAGMGQGRMLREFAALLQALTEHTPLVLVIEDLHWADAATIDLLHLLATDRTPANLLLLASYQQMLAEQTGHPVMTLAARVVAQNPAAELRLAPLRADDIQHWIQQRFGDAELARRLRPWAERQSMGIPLYLRAALHHLVDTGMVAWQSGAWQLVEEPELQRLAEPLRRLLASRFNRLAPDARQLLEAASVVGMQVPVPLLAAVLARDPQGLEQDCSSLTREGEFVRAGKPMLWPDGTRGGTLHFVHDIYRRALYDGVSPGLRQLLYRRLAQRLEAGWGDQVARVAGHLASAYARAAMPEATARVLEMTAHVAVQRLAYVPTIEALQACLQQLTQAPTSPERDTTELRVQLMLANMCLHHHGVTDPRTLAGFERAIGLAQDLGAVREQLRGQLGAILGYTASFQPQKLAALVHDTVALAETRQPTLAAAAHHYSGIALVLSGELPLALWHQERALALTPDPLLPMYIDVPSGAMVHRGRTLVWMGQLSEGQASIEAGVARSRAVGIPGDLLQKLFWAGDTFRTLGLPRGAALLEEARDKAEAYDMPGMHAAASMGLICTRPPAERDTALIEALAPAYCRTGDHLAVLTVSMALTEAYLAQGRVAAAQQAWAKGRAITPAGTVFEPEVLRLQGELITAAGQPPDEAEATWRTGLALARSHQAGFYALRCANALHRSMARRRRAAESRPLLVEALASVAPSDTCPDQQAARRMLAAA